MIIELNIKKKMKQISLNECKISGMDIKLNINDGIKSKI